MDQGPENSLGHPEGRSGVSQTHHFRLDSTPLSHQGAPPGGMAADSRSYTCHVCHTPAGVEVCQLIQCWKMRVQTAPSCMHSAVSPSCGRIHPASTCTCMHLTCDHMKTLACSHTIVKLSLWVKTKHHSSLTRHATRSQRWYTQKSWMQNRIYPWKTSGILG